MPRLIVKVGTQVLTKGEGDLDLKVMEGLVREMIELQKEGWEIILVTSGAVASGMRELGIGKRSGSLIEKQVCAAVGQPLLMGKYRGFFGKYKVKVAQILITRDQLGDGGPLEIMRSTVNDLVERGVIPIFNENDAVANEELRGANMGDNDMLSAKLAIAVGADKLVILTNVDGVYTGPPEEKGSELIRRVGKESILEVNTQGKSPLGTGGMESKIQAAQYAVGYGGVTVIIANGKREGILGQVLNEQGDYTLFEV